MPPERQHAAAARRRHTFLGHIVELEGKKGLLITGLLGRT